MSVSSRLGPAVSDHETELPPAPPPCRSAPPSLPQSVESPPPRNWWLVAGIATLALIGAALMVTRSRPQPAIASELADVAPATVTAAAELFASLYFSGSADVASFYGGDVPDPSGAWINDVTAVAATPLDENRWEVAVAVDSLEPVDGVYQSSPLGFFSIVVAEGAGYPTIAGPPARVAPPKAPPPRRSATEDVSSEQARTAAAFLVEYLTGADGHRFSSIPDLGPIATPYTRVEVVIVGVDDRGRIEISALATTPTGATHAIGYMLQLSEQGGTWTVTGIAPVGT